ncbi:sporulation protein YunB [Geosporobacter ferrireducens]|uniref:Sporulation protein YunB n=1 Tax=Geosporobacter ferrireducens TaxID=1424294 RepID=A0A1D8GCH8_9FIRM|nr:sporulation protein YunB [Geosporobacter ferrireducens]AOT68609.1 sporulation protein YunB [Geosporobacter ferrireducens]MTI54080.1 sporulation protein YunB [Geosporobacter ferrireducens]
MRRKYRRPRRKGNLKAFIAILAIFLFVIYSFLLVDKKVKPSVLAIAEVKAREIATRAINESVNSKVSDDIKYQDLIFIRTDTEGNVTMMQANTVMMNRLASEVALTVQDNIKQIKASSVKVPLGNVFGSQLLAQYGPKININVTPIGMVNVDFKTQFEQSGINQTRHKIYLVVNTQVRIIVPFSTNTTSVETSVPIAETVIVGKVPQSYIFVPENQMLNIMPKTPLE